MRQRRAAGRRLELGDEAVPIAAVDRAHELDDLVVRRRVTRSKRNAGEWSGTPSAADSSSFVTVGSTVCMPPTISIPYRFEQLVERVLLEIAGGETGHERLADVERLDRHRLAVGEPQPLRDDDRLRRRDVEDAAEAGAGRDRAELERPAARASSRAGACPR